MTVMFMMGNEIGSWLREYLARELLPDVPRRAATLGAAGIVLRRLTDPRRFMRWDRRYG